MKNTIWERTYLQYKRKICSSFKRNMENY